MTMLEKNRCERFLTAIGWQMDGDNNGYSKFRHKDCKYSIDVFHNFIGVVVADQQVIIKINCSLLDLCALVEDVLKFEYSNVRYYMRNGTIKILYPITEYLGDIICMDSDKTPVAITHVNWSQFHTKYSDITQEIMYVITANQMNNDGLLN